MEWADAVVSLSGAPIARLPWTGARRQLIMDSRVDATSAIAEAILGATRPPEVWVSASACGFYGTGADRRGRAAPGSGGPVPLTEESPSGPGFLAAVARAWEAAALPAAARTRLVRTRTGLVLGPGGGLLAPLALATKLGLGPQCGDGRQYWPWISERDEVRAIEFALRTPALTGPVNLAGPALATADQVTGAVAGVLRRPSWLRLPAPLLRFTLGEAAQDLLLASQPVVPAALARAGFEFLDQSPEEAVTAALRPGAGDAFARDAR
jgi:uncharacterized protein (TIGR01777 family)